MVFIISYLLFICQVQTLKISYFEIICLLRQSGSSAGLGQLGLLVPFSSLSIVILAFFRGLVKSPLDPYFFLAEKTILALLSIQREHDTHALPACEIRGIAFLFSGHLAPTLPIIAFRSSCPIAKVSARYANLIPVSLFKLIAISLLSLSVEK